MDRSMSPLQSAGQSVDPGLEYPTAYIIAMSASWTVRGTRSAYGIRGYAGLEVERFYTPW